LGRRCGNIHKTVRNPRKNPQSKVVTRLPERLGQRPNEGRSPIFLTHPTARQSLASHQAAKPLRTDEAARRDFEEKLSAAGAFAQKCYSQWLLISVRSGFASLQRRSGYAA
jgi:hypothetical protein